MTLGNVRAKGVRSLWVYCQACHRSAVLDVEAYSDDVPAPAFSPRMVCTAHPRNNISTTTSRCSRTRLAFRSTWQRSVLSGVPLRNGHARRGRHHGISFQQSSIALVRSRRLDAVLFGHFARCCVCPACLIESLNEPAHAPPIPLVNWRADPGLNPQVGVQLFATAADGTRRETRRARPSGPVPPRCAQVRSRSNSEMLLKISPRARNHWRPVHAGLGAQTATRLLRGRPGRIATRKPREHPISGPCSAAELPS